MDNFSKIVCDNCGMRGNWLVFKITLNNNEEVIDQLKINIFKRNNEISGHVEDGNFSFIEIDLGLNEILYELERMTDNMPYIQTQLNGEAFIMADYLNKDPYCRVPIIDINGISIVEISNFVTSLKNQSEKYFNNLYNHDKRNSPEVD